MCSWKVMWEINKIISPLSQCLWSEDLLAWWHTTRSSRPYIWVNLQWNTLYMHLQMIRGYQTRQGANLQWEVPTIIGIWPFYHVTNVRSLDSFKNLYFHYARLMVSKSGRVLSYGRGFSTRTLKFLPCSCCICVKCKKLCNCLSFFSYLFPSITFFGRTDQYPSCMRYAMCFQVMCFRQRQTVMVGLRGSMWNLAL